jgi:hypothetical protein
MLSTLSSSAQALPFVCQETGTLEQDWALHQPLEMVSLESQGVVNKYYFLHVDGRQAIARQYSWMGPYFVTLEETCKTEHPDKQVAGHQGQHAS